MPDVIRHPEGERAGNLDSGLHRNDVASGSSEAPSYITSQSALARSVLRRQTLLNRRVNKIVILRIHTNSRQMSPNRWELYTWVDKGCGAA